MPKSYLITRREPLLFRPNDPAGKHLSAASGVSWLGEDLYIIDDASTFAGIFPKGQTPGESLRLFPPVEGHDHFTEAAGTKPLKPDLEVLLPLPDGSLLALGSGSRNKGVGARIRRTRGAKIFPGRKVEVLDLSALYTGLEQIQDALNVEGALAEGEGLLLFLRGNGVGGRPLLVPLRSLAEAIEGHPCFGPAEEVSLGDLGGVPWGFTDACRLLDGSYLAALTAEDSLDVYSDGAVGGSILYDVQQKELIPILDENGRPFSGKLEGICPDPRRPGCLLGVTDPDDPLQPGELLCLEKR